MTNDGMLSQEEINALLKVSEEDDAESSGQDLEETNVRDYLSSIEEDALGEIGNISIGSSATTLSSLLNQKVSITTPEVSIIRKAELYQSFSYEHVNVQVNYVEGFLGKNLFVVQSEDAAIIADIMLGNDGTNPDKELTEIHLSAVQEVMNQMMGSAATSMSTIFGKRVNISPPMIEFKSAEEENGLADEIDEEIFVKVSFQLQVGELIDSNIMQLIPFPFAYDLVEQLMNMSTPSEAEEVNSLKRKIENNEQSSSEMVAEPQTDQGITQEEVESSPQYIGSAVDKDNSSIQSATFSNFEQVELNKKEQRNLDMLLDIPLKVTVELGRTNQPIKDILDLSSGSIIELDKLAGEPVDVLVNDKLIAKGEVVVIDENFGVRVTDIVSQTERLMKLK